MCCCRFQWTSVSNARTEYSKPALKHNCCAHDKHTSCLSQVDSSSNLLESEHDDVNSSARSHNDTKVCNTAHESQIALGVGQLLEMGDRARDY